MRAGLRDSGWVGSLFDEPIDQVKAPTDRCICHQDCPQYETCETEALDKSSKVYYLLRCVKGKFPACANCMCMACDRYHECHDGPEMGQPGGTRYRMCNRPISITGCLDYSGSIPWRSEAYCKKCDHVCDLRKKLVWAPRVRCDLNPIEPTKKPTEEPSPVQLDGKWHDISIIDNVVKVDGVICDDNFVPLTHPAPKAPKAKKQPKLKSADYNGNALPGSNADICSHCDCETCGLNQAHLDYTDKEWKGCPPCGCDQCLGKDELQPTTLCGRKAALTAEVMGNTESQLPREQLHVDTVQRYVRPAECAEGSCTACQCQTCGNRNLNCALNGDEPVLICSTCWLNHPHHWKVYAAIVKTCPHWRDAATFPADIYAPGHGPCPETACELRYNGEGGPCLCHSCKYGPGSCDTSCNIPGYPMETGQYGCEWYAKKEVATVEVVTQPAAELDVPDLVKVGDLVTRLHTRDYVYDIRKVTRVEKTDAGWQICGDRWDDFRHPRRKQVSKNEPIIQWGVTGWKVEDGKFVPLGQKVVEETSGAMYNETYADERLIVLTLEQVEQLVAVEEAEDVNGPTNYTHVWLKPEKAKGTLNDLHSDWPLLGHARFVDTSAAALAKIPSGRRSEVCQDEPECEHCLCKACEHQKACRLDNTLNCCSPCKTSGGAHHHKAVDCEGCTPSP